MHIVEDVRLFALQGKALLLETMRLIALTCELLMYVRGIDFYQKNEREPSCCLSISTHFPVIYIRSLLHKQGEGTTPRE